MRSILLIAAAGALAGCDNMKSAHPGGAEGADHADGHDAAGAHGADKPHDEHADSHGDAEAHATTDKHSDEHGPASAAAPAHWTYDAQHDWKNVSADAAACAVGGRQSPINLYDQPRVDEPDLTLAYAGVEGRFFNNGHTLQVAAPAGLAMNAGGEVYQLVQAHFHAPSEHRIDNESFGLELHFVHKTAAGKLGVLGVVFREGKENAALAALWSRIPGAVGEDKAVNVYFDPAAFLPADRSYYLYDGSLTTPPCSEGVRWRVLRTPIEASAAQIAAFREVVGANARELQPINGRLVTLGE